MQRYVIILAIVALTSLLAAQSAHYRIYNIEGDELSLVQMTDRLADYDVVFFGEWHGDVTLQALQVEVFDAMAQQEGRLYLSLEMYERDQQSRIDSLRGGLLDYETFISRNRTWPTLNHELMRHALEAGAPIIAANVPRYMASKTVKLGTDWLDKLEPPENRWVATTIHTWANEYRDRFYKTIFGSSDESEFPPQMKAMAEGMFTAQCLKDDTMAESILHTRILSSHSQPRVLHVCGEFHSAARLGTVSRLQVRSPNLKIAVITPIAADDDAFSLPDNAGGEGDFLIVLSAPEPDEDAPRAHPMPRGVE